MRPMQVLIGFAAALACAALLAQSDADYQGYMKTVASSNGKFQKGITAKDSSVVVSEGTTLETTFKQVEEFWQKRGVADAANFAKQAHTAAAAASKAASSGNFDQAATEGRNLAGTCMGCHMAHREKGESGFKIK
jgi:hypothetical protein